MSIIQILAMFSSLSEQSQEKVAKLISELSQNEQIDRATMPITEPEDGADPLAIFGLAADNPLSLEIIRKKAWSRS